MLDILTHYMLRHAILWDNIRRQLHVKGRNRFIFQSIIQILRFRLDNLTGKIIYWTVVEFFLIYKNNYITDDS